MNNNNYAKVQRSPNDASNRAARNYVYERSEATGSDLLVLMALADYADDERQCFPTVPTLADHAGVSERTVKRSTKTLAELGEITVETRQDAGGASTSNLYTLMVLPADYKKNDKSRSDPTPLEPELPALNSYELEEARQLATDYDDDGLLRLLNIYELFSAGHIFGDKRISPTVFRGIRARVKNIHLEQHQRRMDDIEEMDAEHRAGGVLID